MTALKSFLRTSLLIALACVAFICLASLDEGKLDTLIIAAAVAAVDILCLCRLYNRWRRIDPWIAKYHRWSLKGMQ